MLLDPKTGKPTRTSARMDADGTKERVEREERRSRSPTPTR